MADANTLIEDIVGRRVTELISLAWLGGDGAREALVDNNSALPKDYMNVWLAAS